MQINLYCIINNNRIASEKVPVYNDITKLFESIKNNKKNDNIIRFLYLDLILDNEKRKQLMINIFDEINNQEMIIKYYLVITDGRIIGIKSFDTLKDNIDEIKNLGYESVKKEVNKDNIEEKIEEYNNKIENSTEPIDYIKNIVYLGSIYEIYNEEIEKYKKKMNDDLIDIVKNTREELIEEDRKAIKNEYDLLNDQVEKVLNGRKGLKITSCSYNGKDITYDELIEELFSHKFPAYMTEKNIMDTLNDEYVIETNYITIVRSNGKIDIRY